MMGRGRVLNALLHRRQRREVKDQLDVRHGAVDRVRVADVADDQLRAWLNMLQVGRLPGAQVIENAHPPPRGSQGLDQVGTDEPSSAGH